MPDFGLDKAALRAILGITGPNFVGDTDSQVLSNKTLTTPKINTLIRDITGSTTVLITMPITATTLIGTDTTDTLTNKTATFANNTFKQTTPALGSLLKDNGTKFVPLPRGTANQILATNSGATDVGWTSSVYGLSQSSKLHGSYYTIGNADLTTGLRGILAKHTSPQTPTAVYDTTEGVCSSFASAATSGINVGLVSPTTGVGIGRRLYGMYMKTRWKIDSTTTSRMFFGVTSNTTLAISDTPLATGDSGCLVGFTAGGSNFVIIHNDGTSPVTTDNITGPIAKNASFHTIEIFWSAAGSNITVTFDGVAQTVSTDLPATTSNLFFNQVGQTSAATARTVTIHDTWVEVEK